MLYDEDDEEDEEEFPEYDRRIYGEGIKFQRIRRITGYLTGDINTWNNAKRAELRDRTDNKYNVSPLVVERSIGLNKPTTIGGASYDTRFLNSIRDR